MKKIVRKSAREKACQALRSECLNGKWDGKLPGARTLALSLGVSPTTVIKALAVLASEGLVLRSGPKKAYQVNPEYPKHQKNKAQSQEKLVLILIPDPWEKLNVTTREALKHLKSYLTDQGWKINEQVIDYGNAQKTHDSWDHMVDIKASTPVIALWGTPSIADWAARHKMRILFIGGDLGGRDGTMVAMSATKIIDDAMDSLIALGHRYIVMPLLNRQEVSKALVKSAFKLKIESLGEVYQDSYHTPESCHISRESIKNTMMMYAKTRMPTGIIFFEWRELISAYCCLSEMGLKIPQDVSFIYLDDLPDAVWFFPELTRYAFPSNALTKTIKTWLADTSRQSELITLAPHLIKGSSIAPPPK